MSTPRPHQRLGDAAWSKMPKVVRSTLPPYL
jgi:hypothetical protein